jgi:hypothetical protein
VAQKGLALQANDKPMKTTMYLSRDLVEAIPMSYGEFINLMEIEDEESDPQAPGYMRQLSEENYEWIPAEDFEDAHTEVGDLHDLEPYQQRLMVERTIVFNNYLQLKKSFIKTTFLALPYEMRQLLQAQERAMARYLEVLNKRCIQSMN